MSADANVFRWAIRRFFSKTELDAGALDARYFAESEFIATSAGAGDAGKPFKLDSGGKLDASMIDSADLVGYALLAGRAGGQTLYGGTAANQDIIIHGTSNATRTSSYVILQPTAGNVGIGTSTPSTQFHMVSSTGGGRTGFLIEAAIPNINLYENDAAADNRFWDMYADAATLNLRAVNDANSAAGNIMTVTRTGTTVNAITLGGTTVNVSGTLQQAGVNVVTTTGSQTLTNKTLTAPVISTISNTGTLTLPTSTDTLVGRATTDTLTNKTLTTPTISATGFTNAQHAHTGASSGGQLDHGAALTGLTDDDHTQYALLAGRSSGQTLNGGNAANEDLTIHGTAHATKTSSYVIIQPSGGQTIVGASSPLVTHPFEVQANNYAITLNPGFGSATNYISSYTSGSPAPLALYGSRVFVDGDTLGIGTAKTPASATDTGVTGQICWNSTHLFVAVATNTWKRVALTTW